MTGLRRLTGRLAAVCALILAAGCQSYNIMQSSVFVDDDGSAVIVEFGRSESDHVNTFRSPVNGEEMDFKSKLVVRVSLPNGDRFVAWQCMNFLPRGTMYKTDDEEWMLLANGFSCVVYRQRESRPDLYDEVYRGVLCDAPSVEGGVHKDERWKPLPKAGSGREYKRKR